MRIIGVRQAALTFALCANAAIAQTTQPRHWSRVSAGAGFAISNSELGGDGGTTGLARVLTAGVRLHDLVGASVERLQWIGDTQEERDFRLAAVDVYPAYRAGIRGLRVSGGYGTARVLSHPYAGGHGTEEVSGSTKAWLLGVNYDFRIGIVAITPFAQATRTRNSNLHFESCQTSYDASGHFSTFCGSGQTDRPASLSSYGVAISIR